MPPTPPPLWGYRFLVWAERDWPRWIFRPIFGLGVWVAVALKKIERRSSREYLSVVHGRPAGAGEVWRHFQVFTEILMLRLRVARGEAHQYAAPVEHGAEFEALLTSGEPVLWGTFHFGHSDLMGFALAQRGQSMSMVRMRGADAGELALLGERFGGMRFVWVNDPADVLFALKERLESGDSVALQCDRVRHAAKTAAFEFLGAPRIFPVTIYHLAVLFGRPVMFCFGVPEGAGGTRVIATPVFRPDPHASRAENLAAGHVHFQGVLTRLEGLVRQHPLLWFNFLPLNPVAVPRPEAVPADVA